LLTPGTTDQNTGRGVGNVPQTAYRRQLFSRSWDGTNDRTELNTLGETNLTMGQNEVQEVRVLTNGYGGQCGGMAGSNVETSHARVNERFSWGLKY